MKKIAIQVVKTIVTVGIIAYIVQLIDWQAFRALWPNIGWVWVALAPIAYFVGLWGTAYRWTVMLKALNVVLGIPKTLLAYLMGAFYNLVLPGGLGGDLIRVGYAKKETQASTTLIASTVVLERLFGSMTAFQIGAVSIVFLSEEHVSQLGWSTLGTLLGFTTWITFWMLVFFLFWDKVSAKIPERMKAGRLPGKIFAVAEQIQKLPWETRHRVVLGTAIFQVGDAVAIYFLAKGIGLDIPVTIFFLLNPFVYLAMVFPISLGGLGVREGVVVAFLSLIGVTSTQGATLAFLIYLNHALVGLGGGVVQLMLGLHPKEDAEAIEREQSEISDESPLSSDGRSE